MPSSPCGDCIGFLIVLKRAVVYTHVGFVPALGFSRGNQAMSSTGSVTRWINQLEAGDLAAAQPLWDRYFQHLVELARRKLGSKPRAKKDEEDVALSAFDSFCRGLKD